MGLQTTESAVLNASPADVYPLVSDLNRYPEWMRLVHAAEFVDDDTWIVELRAQVGPFARSKRLRMQRTLNEPERRVRFERSEIDGRRHASWVLDVTLGVVDEASTLVAMHLRYDGSLWTGHVLDRVLDDEIRRGREGLTDLVNGRTDQLR